MITHFSFYLKSRSRGFYLITSEVLSNLPALPENGLLNLFIQHTSAGLSINENADPSVLVDFESYLNHIVPENMSFITHDMEGSDDMPAHIKSALVGSSITIPIKDSRLMLGTWQGIYLCEFRNQPHQRRLVASLYT